MIKLCKAGFFKELSHGDENGLSIYEMIRQTANANESRITHYLRSGAELVICFGVVSDVLNPSSEVMISPHIMTDGFWVWPLDLAYYVENYHVDLPSEFVTHMEKTKWQMPDISDEQLLNFEF
jgi:hypothetical protein